MLPRIYGENLFDDIFDDSFFTGHDPLFGKNGRNLMKTDVRETDDAKSYRLSIDLPGFKKDEITLDLKDGYLTMGDRPGLGIDIDLTALEPSSTYEHPHWRRADGTVQDW